MKWIDILLLLYDVQFLKNIILTIKVLLVLLFCPVTLLYQSSKAMSIAKNIVLIGCGAKYIV